MKKLICALLISVTSFGTIAYGGTIPKVNVNGNKVLLQNSPVIIDGTTYIPLRSVSEYLGADVSWDAATKTATITQGTTEIKQEIEKNIATVNGEVITLNAPAILRNGVTFVPIRFVTETLGGTINYDNNKNQINIEYTMPTDKGQAYDFLGRLKRTENLPKNANVYEYILQGVPNEMYETEFAFNKGNWKNPPVEGKDYIYPINMKAKGDRVHNGNLKIWKELVEKNLDYRLNVNYNTVSADNWSIPLMNTTYYGYGDEERYLTKFPKITNEYMQYLKDNHIIIEGDYYVEPSMIYDDMSTRVRCWIKFRLTSDITNEAYLLTFTGFPENMKTNVWYSGYCDIAIGTNQPYDGSNLKVTDGGELTFGEYKIIN